MNADCVAVPYPRCRPNPRRYLWSSLGQEGPSLLALVPFRPCRSTRASAPRLLAVLLLLALEVVFTAGPGRRFGREVSWPQCPVGPQLPPENTEFLVAG